MSEPSLSSAVAALAARLAGFMGDRGPLSATAERVAADLLACEIDPQGAGDRARERWARFEWMFDLSRFECDLVALAALADEHEGAAAILAELHPRHEAAAWIGLAHEVLLDSERERHELRAAVLDGPLRRYCIVRTDRAPFAHRTLHLAPGLWETLHGHDAWPPGVDVVDVAEPLGLDRWVREDNPTHAVAMLEFPSTTVVVTAADTGDAIMRADALVRAAGRTPRHFAGDSTQADPAGVALLCAVRGEVPVLVAGPACAQLLALLRGPAVVLAEPGGDIDVGDRNLVTVPVRRPTLDDQLSMWHSLLPDAPDAARGLAGVHRVNARRATQAVGDARHAQLVRSDAPSQQLIAQHVRQRAVTSLPAAARLVTPTAMWTDLVIPDEPRGVLASAVQRCREQVTVLHEWGLGHGRTGSAGVRMLFAGPPGTGKTMAAEVMAHELELDLLVVDLASLVSRWLGETEKNLAEVFDAAERCQAVLFFDEADAMFARRTDVGDAHDRWANLETAYLLDRIERFEGVTVLATNLRANIDSAFIRRLEFVVDFQEPGRRERELLWAGNFPSRAPVAPDVHFGELAQLYTMSGSVIRNAAIAAAFLAAADGTAITQNHLVAAVRREYDKAGRSFPGVPRRLVNGDPHSHPPATRQLTHNGPDGRSDTYWRSPWQRT